MIDTRSSLVAADGVELYWQHWPTAEPARGTVLVVHGLGEHSGRYVPLATRLVIGGWHVVGYDQRGHGWSQGARGAIPTPDALLRDLAQVVEATRARLPAPLVLLGASLGGLLAARFVAAGIDAPPGDAAWWRPGRIDALALASPALATDLTPVQRLLVALLPRLAPGASVRNGLDPAALSRDPTVVEAYRSDAQVHDRIGARLARFIVDAGRHVQARASRWNLPTLLLWAGADRCIAPRGSRAFADAAPPQLVEAQCFESLAHEIFNEPEKALVYDRLMRWLEQRGH